MYTLTYVTDFTALTEHYNLQNTEQNEQRCDTVYCIHDL